MLDLLFIGLLLAWSWLVGRSILQRLNHLPETNVDAVALATTLGLGAASLLTFLLAETGILSLSSLLSTFSVALAIALIQSWPLPLSSVNVVHRVHLGDWSKRNLGQLHSQEQQHCKPHSKKERDLLGVGFDAAFALILCATFLVALVPPTDGDALCYHLQVPKLILERGSMSYEPDLHETVYPLVTEMLYAIGLAFRGPVACRLIQWSLGLLFAMNVNALARPFLGNRARWAGTIVIGVPAISNGMGAPLIDVSMATFATAALVAWTSWFERPTLSGAWITGIFAGLAIGVKYPALVWVGLLGLGMLLTYRKIGWKRFVQHTAIFATVTLLIGGCWYLRAWYWTGNPVHPFFRSFFGSGFDVVLADDKRPMTATFSNLITLLGPLTLQPTRFDSLSHQIGPAFLLFLPALVLWRPPRKLWGLLAFAFVFLTLCFVHRQSPRFVLPAFGPMALGVGWLTDRWSRNRRFGSRLLVTGVLLVVGFQALIALSRVRHGLEVSVGLQSRHDYLMEHESTYRVGRWIDSHLDDNSRLIGQDHRGFYIPRYYAMEKAHRRRTGLGSRGEGSAEIVQQFRSNGFTHLLLCPPEPLDAVEFDPTLNGLIDDWLATHRPIYQESITDGDGVTRHYSIYELNPPISTANSTSGEHCE